MKFSEIDEENPLFLILLSFRKVEGELSERLSNYVPASKSRYLYVPFFHGELFFQPELGMPNWDELTKIYMAVYDRFSKEFISILDEFSRTVIDLRPKAKKHGGKGAIGMG